MPLYLLKIEVIPRDLVFLEGLVFLLFIFPARLLGGLGVCSRRAAGGAAALDDTLARSVRGGSRRRGLCAASCSRRRIWAGMASAAFTSNTPSCCRSPS